MTTLKINEIILDGGTQTRAGYYQKIIDDYSEDMKSGDKFPAIVVFFDGSNYWLADGFHRIKANIKNGNSSIDCEIKQGTVRDAILYSVKVNSQHGLRRTNADKRRAVERLLLDEEWCCWSDREIAKQCRVDHKTVSKIRDNLQTGGEIPTSMERKGSDGKIYNVNKELTSEELLEKIKESPDELQLSLIEYFQETIDNKEKTKNTELQEKLNNLQFNYQELQKNIKTLVLQKQDLDSTLHNYKSKLNNTENKLKDYRKVESMENELLEVDKELQEKQLELNDFLIANLESFNDSKQYQEVLQAIDKANELIKKDLFKIPTLHLTDVSKRALAPQLKPIVETVENWAYIIKTTILDMNKELI